MAATACPSVPWVGVRGRLLAWLLQRRFVRFLRVQLGFVEYPAQYQAFLAEVVGPRLAAVPGPLGVFGVGTHTEFVLKAIPGLADRIHCFTDNNAALWQKTRFGKPVLPPAEAVASCNTFLLSTTVFQRVLARDLARLRFSGAVIAVDDDVPPSWFLS